MSEKPTTIKGVIVEHLYNNPVPMGVCAMVAGTATLVFAGATITSFIERNSYEGTVPDCEVAEEGRIRVDGQEFIITCD